MSEPAQTVRLHILLCDGLSGLSRIVDRLSVVGIAPNEIRFRRSRGNLGYAHIDLGRTEPFVAKQLATRLEQLVPVAWVRLIVDTAT